MDVSSVFRVIQQGGPPAIFLLLTFISLVLSGVLRMKREVDAKEDQCQALLKQNEALGVRLDRQQDLFARSLELLERRIVPYLERSR